MIPMVVAKIMRVAADILHGEAVILCGMASILSDRPDILHAQHQVFWVLEREKYTFFQKCSKIGLVAL